MKTLVENKGKEKKLNYGDRQDCMKRWPTRWKIGEEKETLVMGLSHMTGILFGHGCHHKFVNLFLYQSCNNNKKNFQCNTS